MNALKAYHSDEKIKTTYVNRIKDDIKQDRLIKGKYWENGKGCAVGCTIRGNSHKEYELQLGIPQMLARLEDRIFEGLPNKEAMLWPEQFLKAVPVGADLSKVSWLFLQWLMLNTPTGNKEIKAALKECADFLAPLTKGEKINLEKAQTFRNKMWALRSKYWPAAAAATAADAAYAAAAATAATAAYAADAAYAAAAAAAATAAAYAAYAYDARGEFYIKMSKKLLQLIKEAK